MTNILIDSIFGFFSGILAAMGLGGGGVLILCLTVFDNVDQLKAQGINLFFFIPISFIAIIFYMKKRLILWKIIVPCVLIGIPCALLGYYVSQFIDKGLLSKIFAIFLLIIGVSQFFNRNEK